MAPPEETDCLSESELDRLSDEQVLAYIVEQREAGRPHCAKQALAVLAHGHWDRIRCWVAAKVPRQDVDDVTAAVVESGLRSAFDGRSVGELVKWLRVITSRRISDYYSGREGDPATDPLPQPGDEEEGLFGAEPSTGPEEDAVHIRLIAGRLLEGRSEVHRTVIRLYGPGELGYEGRSAREAAERTEELHRGSGMTEANVHQIWRRFRSDLEDELGLGGS